MWSYPFTLGIRKNESITSTTMSEDDGPKHQDNIFEIYIVVVITILVFATISVILLNFFFFEKKPSQCFLKNSSKENYSRRKPDRFVANIYNMYPNFFEVNYSVLTKPPE